METDWCLAEEQPEIDWLLRLGSEYGRAIGELNYIFCSDDYLLEMNRQYLNHDYYTDVITFDLAHSELETDAIHGDVYISADRVGEHAKDFGVSFETELRRVMAHGLLHLLGFDDTDEEKSARMREEEERCLQLV